MSGRIVVENQAQGAENLREQWQAPQMHAKKLAQILTEDAALYLSDAVKAQLAERLLKVVEGNVVLDQMVDALQVGLTALLPEVEKEEARLSENPKEGDDQDIKMVDYSKLLEKAMKVHLEMVSGAVQQHNLYTEIKDIVEPDDDDELRVTHEEGEARFKCPLTTTFFKDPVKSTACGHTYESLAIENHIRNAAKDRKPATCPCCKKPITAANLVPDKEKLLDMKQRNAQSQQQQQEEEPDDDAEDEIDDDDDYTFVK